MSTINTDTNSPGIKPDIKNSEKEKILAAIGKCIPLLEKIADQSEFLVFLPESQRIALIVAAGKISRPDKKEIKKRNKDRKQQKQRAIVEKERRLRADTGIRRAREDTVFINALFCYKYVTSRPKKALYKANGPPLEDEVLKESPMIVGQCNLILASLFHLPVIAFFS